MAKDTFGCPTGGHTHDIDPGQGRDDADLYDSGAAFMWSLICLSLLFGGAIGASLMGLLGGAG